MTPDKMTELVGRMRGIAQKFRAVAFLDKTAMNEAADLDAAADIIESMAQRENEKLTADARRYRFIRDTPWGPDLINVIQMQMNGKWDAAIDAAMAAEKGEE